MTPSLYDFNEAISRIRLHISLQETEESWDTIASSITDLTSLINSTTAHFQHETVVAIREFHRYIINALKSERTRLSGPAVDLVVAAATELNGDFEPLLPLFFPTLLVLCGRTNKVVLNRVKGCIIAIIENTQLVGVLPYFLQHIKEKSPSLRLVVAESTLACVNSSNPSDLEKDARVKDIEALIKATSRDANADVRKTGKKVFEAYQMLLPGKVDSFTAPLSPTIKKYLGVKPKSTVPNQPRPNHLILSKSTSSASNPQQIRKKPSQMLASSTHSMTSTSVPASSSQSSTAAGTSKTTTMPPPANVKKPTRSEQTRSMPPPPRPASRPESRTKTEAELQRSMPAPAQTDSRAPSRSESSRSRSRAEAEPQRPMPVPANSGGRGPIRPEPSGDTYVVRRPQLPSSRSQPAASVVPPMRIRTVSQSAASTSGPIRNFNPVSQSTSSHLTHPKPLVSSGPQRVPIPEPPVTTAPPEKPLLRVHPQPEGAKLPRKPEPPKLSKEAPSLSKKASVKALKVERTQSAQDKASGPSTHPRSQSASSSKAVQPPAVKQVPTKPAATKPAWGGGRPAPAPVPAKKPANTTKPASGKGKVLEEGLKRSGTLSHSARSAPKPGQVALPKKTNAQPSGAPKDAVSKGSSPTPPTEEVAPPQDEQPISDNAEEEKDAVRDKEVTEEKIAEEEVLEEEIAGNDVTEQKETVEEETVEEKGTAEEETTVETSSSSPDPQEATSESTTTSPQVEEDEEPEGDTTVGPNPVIQVIEPAPTTPVKTRVVNGVEPTPISALFADIQRGFMYSPFTPMSPADSYLPQNGRFPKMPLFGEMSPVPEPELDAPDLMLEKLLDAQKVPRHALMDMN
ncbi:hypothetical protein D9758_002102 [Tetrapyrgos nigripes]|uniref:TOG domain-containing protein n=1 Tax=Tetrapyrgos nigripes TaxID=182062 RepID=A0A8H5GTN4_9AGAR|nr:hypothetical protein D9758_002102 [Tetrapyrgos nigripes]